mgnify:CR=1 FL=1
MKNKKYLSITSEKLAEIQKVLMTANFELEEMWSPDDKDETQIWSNNEYNSLIQLKIVSDKENATRKDVVNELIDVWFEIRSLKEIFENLLNDDEEFSTPPEEDFLKNFENKVKATQLEWEENKEYMDFLYKRKIDPAILTYLRLEEDEKERIKI